MSRKIKDNLIGQKFGKLKVMEFSHQNKKGLAYWKCICDCGKYKIIRGMNLTHNKSNSCGCNNHKNLIHQGQPLKYDFYESSIRYIYSTYKHNSKKHSREFKISVEDFKNIINKNCYYCGEPPSNSYYNKFHDKTFVYNGIDRLDNNLGYIDGNCVPCCSMCNLAKKNFTKKQFLDWISKVYKYQHSLNPLDIE